MIAVEKFGRNFMGALGYNLKKLQYPDRNGRAEMLASSFSSLSPAMILKEVELIRELRPALSKYVWHTSLNFSKDEQPNRLTNDNMLEMALDYMNAMGYDDNQYLIVKHNDADHPHVHMLVNRIKYDGSVVSDSNNYQRSQQVLRKLEKQYNLISLEQSNHITKQRYNNRTADQGNSIKQDKSRLKTQRSLTKNEIEKSIRTGKPSDKSILQAFLNPLIGTKGIPLQIFIAECERRGICLLFNQASTGRVSGITYFINDFKIKGQVLGNRFKWAELIKFIDYEQDRDSQAISSANDKAKSKYGEYITGTGTEERAAGRTGDAVKNFAPDAAQRNGQRQTASGDELPLPGNQTADSITGGDVSGTKNQDSLTKEINDLDYSDSHYTDHGIYVPGIQIAHDEDDAKYRRKGRKRGR